MIGHGYGWGMGGGGMLLIWILVIVAIVWLVREVGLVDRGSGRDPRSYDAGRDSALETLRERYARGEIDEDEFERRKQRLV